jgi:FtsP/CotA-like multicopper oxidase with cupredoxin domain
MNKTRIFILFIFTTLLLTACQENSDREVIGNTENDSQELSVDTNSEKQETKTIKEFDISTQALEWEFSGGVSSSVWTYNGTIPGNEIRVTVGDNVRTNLLNNIEEPVTIHWHGMILPNQMDGVAGVTQNAVNQGETFTYEFQAEKAGTYWYHSHQDSSNQVDMGLYGPFIVEPKEKSYDRDFVLMLDEWLLETDNNSFNSNESNPIEYNPMLQDAGDMDTEMLYNAFTVNGKRYPDVKPIHVKTGETVRLRFINAGYMKHRLDLHGQPYKVVAADANDVLSPILTTDILEIAPSERIDIEFTVENEESWYVQSVDFDFASNDLKVPIVVNDSPDNVTPTDVDSTKNIIEATDYGEMKPLFSLNEEPSLEYEMRLGTSMQMGQGMNFTINEEVFPEIPPLNVEKGDLVKVKMVNDSRFDHPMHLHGHHFQVISKNGETLSKPLVKDVINVKPNEEYTILFEADNPGHWAFHCHDLLHAKGGMMALIKYTGYSTSFNIHEGNIPE